MDGIVGDIAEFAELEKHVVAAVPKRGVVDGWEIQVAAVCIPHSSDNQSRH